MKILGPATAKRYTVARNCPADVGQPWPDMVDALWAAALEHGIDPVVMVAQSAHETGWGKFGGAVPATFFNTAGIKVRDPGTLGDQTLAHAQFASWQTGARAHAQHLRKYCGKGLLPLEDLVDPRWVWITGTAVTDVEQLGGKWAPSADYGLHVAAVVKRLAGL